MKRAFVILLSALILIPSLSYAYVDPSSNQLMNSYLFYVAGVLIIHIILGIATKSINESKGYTGGFAWGFFLGIIGIIVVACKANANTTSDPVSNTDELERLAKLHESGTLTDDEFNEMKQKLLTTPKAKKKTSALTLTRNQVYGNVPWVRIPPAPHAGTLDFPTFSGSVFPFLAKNTRIYTLIGSEKHVQNGTKTIPDCTS